jgi:hypothetical protein
VVTTGRAAGDADAILQDDDGATEYEWGFTLRVG